MTAKFEPRTMDIIAYSFAIRDKLESDYYCAMPKVYVANGEANSYCANYIVSAYENNTPVADAAFVLCNKIRRREWESYPGETEDKEIKASAERAINARHNNKCGQPGCSICDPD